jgi:hypothetical protein
MDRRCFAVQLRAGARLESVVCETQAIVVKAPSVDVDLRCGGQAMVPIGTEAAGGDVAGQALRR